MARNRMPNRLFIRVSDMELARIRQMTEETGLTMSAFVRKRALGEPIIARLHVDYLALRRDIAGLCNNVNQIAYAVNSRVKQPGPAAEEAREMAQKTYNLVKGVMNPDGFQ